MLDSFLRVRDVCTLTKLSRATLWRMERAGRFPHKVKLSTRAVGWRMSDVDAWIAGRCEGEGELRPNGTNGRGAA
jgi:prophage regulatory protein